MIKKLKILGPILLVVILTAIIIGYGQIKNKNQNKVAGEATTIGQKINVSLKLTYPDGEAKDYNVSLDEAKANAFEVLKQVLAEEGKTLEYQDYSIGVFIKSIDGIPNTQTEYWGYSVNDKDGTVAADKYELKNGDIIKWKFTK